MGLEEGTHVVGEKHVCFCLKQKCAVKHGSQ